MVTVSSSGGRPERSHQCISTYLWATQICTYCGPSACAACIQRGIKAGCCAQFNITIVGGRMCLIMPNGVDAQIARDNISLPTELPSSRFHKWKYEYGICCYSETVFSPAFFNPECRRNDSSQCFQNKMKVWDLKKTKLRQHFLFLSLRGTHFAFCFSTNVQCFQRE